MQVATVVKKQNMINTSEKTIKVVLIIALLLCLLNMPYGFFQLVRFIALIGFGVLAYNAMGRKQSTEMILYGALALLFQPFIKLSLGRELWNIVDVIVAIGLTWSLFATKKVESK